MKYLSVAILMAFSCLLFSACSSDADLTPYENKIAQLQTTLDSLTNGSGGGSSITLSPELQGKDALLNSQIEALKKELKDIEDKHKSDINAKEKEIADLDELLAKFDGGSLLEIQEALKKLQVDKEQQIKEQEMNLAELEENKKKLEQDLLDATDNETKWKNLLLLENNKTFAQKRGLPYIGLVSVTISRQEAEEIEKDESDEGESNPEEEIGEKFLPYTIYSFVYDNGTEVTMNFYDSSTGQECTLYENDIYPRDCNYDDNRLIKISDNSEVSWLRHNISFKVRKDIYGTYMPLLKNERKEYLNEIRRLYYGDNSAYTSYRVEFSYDGFTKADNTTTQSNIDLADKEDIVGNIFAREPDIIEEYFYQGHKEGGESYLRRNYITVDTKVEETGSSKIMKAVVKEEHYFPKSDGEFEKKSSVCDSYELKSNGKKGWYDEGRPCYYK